MFAAINYEDSNPERIHPRLLHPRQPRRSAGRRLGARRAYPARTDAWRADARWSAQEGARPAIGRRVRQPHGQTADATSGIAIRPVLLRKGRTRLGLHGVLNVKDQRMHFELRANRVRMFIPRHKDAWFNVLVLHQNRYARSLWFVYYWWGR
jgi:hypothetical protein